MLAIEPISVRNDTYPRELVCETMITTTVSQLEKILPSAQNISSKNANFFAHNKSKSEVSRAELA